MNKRNTIRLTKIASLTAMLLPLAFTGSAVAGKNDNNGQKGSISLFSICHIQTEVEYDHGQPIDVPRPYLKVATTITDASSNLGDAVLDGMIVQAVEKYKGPWRNPDNFANIGDPDPSYPTLVKGEAEETSRIPLCQAVSGQTLSTDARSVNALITVEITDDHNNKEMGFTARCSDDPDTLYIDEVAELNVWKQDLCNP